ncbi:MAG: hypothetical protein WD423_05440 [Rhodothermales bacterium]
MSTLNRRQFSKLLGLGAASLVVSPLHARSDVPTMYYVDGYHGGVRGHMPAGAWRDVLNVMRAVPEWKISLEIEPVSWAVLERNDPEAYDELKAYLEDSSSASRVEMLSVTFAQPYGWDIGGESNVRQLMRGLRITREHFPEAVLKTYAVQEPCWTSCLPQILRSLGFERAVLKNPGTAWGGYAAAIDAETVHWVGPDGTTIPTAPRYAVEELVNAWETESVDATPEFAQKCVDHGIAHPVGMMFQDLGWSAHPRVEGNHIRYVTWREYFEEIVDAPEVEWAFGIEDSLVTLPWGEQTIQTVTQQVRAAETKVLVAEKMSALAWLETGRMPNADALQEAWDDLMWSQHHDSWITATTRSGRDAWAFLVARWTLNAEELCDGEIDQSTAALVATAEDGVQAPVDTQHLRVFNTLGRPRRDIVEVTIATDRGTQDLRVFDAEGRALPAQVIQERDYDPFDVEAPFDPNRELPPGYDEESINAATLLFAADLPAMGYDTFRIERSVTAESDPPTERPSAPPTSTLARAASDGTVVLENDLYRLRIDPARGGAVTSLIVKASGEDVVDDTSERLFNEYRGYFVEREEWCSSTDAAADVEIRENGPIRAVVRIEGRVGDARYRTDVSLLEGEPQIDFHATLYYDDETWIGDPWDIEPENRRTERRKSHHDGRWKLQAFFPTPGDHTIYKNAAYDVTRSRLDDTFFQGWDEIKHNIVVDWVDAVDASSGRGLAVFSDHTTAYTHGPEHPLALVLAWGWEAGFWWGKQPLEGVQRIHYAAVPHAGSWDAARLSELNARWKERPIPRLLDGEPTATRVSLIEASDGLEIPTMLVEDGHLIVRVFNAEATGNVHAITFGRRPASVALVELDGRHVETLDVIDVDGRPGVQLEMPRFGLRTLRCAFGQG